MQLLMHCRVPLVDKDRSFSQHLQIEPLTDTRMYQLHLRNVSLHKTKRWKTMEVKKPILQGVNVNLTAGRLTGIMGESGSGKTSLLNIITGFSSQRLVASGKIRMTSDAHGAARLGAVAFFHYSHKAMPFYDLTGMENILIGFIFSRRDEDASWTDVLEDLGSGNGRQSGMWMFLVNSMKLHHCLDKKMKNMSSGEQRRLAIVVGCLKPSEVVLLDEPLLGLDSAVALKTVKFLKMVASRLGKLVILIVHQPSQETYDALDYLIIMKCGKCMYCGPRVEALDRISVASENSNSTEGERFLSNSADRLLEIVSRADTHTIKDGIHEFENNASDPAPCGNLCTDSGTVSWHLS